MSALATYGPAREDHGSVASHPIPFGLRYRSPAPRSTLKPFHVYMLRCADESYYVGHTDELERRIAQHQAGEIDGYTRKHGPVEFVWSQETATREEALAAERRIKGWARAKKEALIRGDWKAIQRHAWGTRNPLPESLHEDGLKDPSAVSERGEPQPGPSIPQDERVQASIPQPERDWVACQRRATARVDTGLRRYDD